MKLWVAYAAAIAEALIGSEVAWTEDTPQTLQGMQMTAPMDWPTVPQMERRLTPYGILKDKIKLPPGFR
jgi:hypothetical protein